MLTHIETTHEFPGEPWLPRLFFSMVSVHQVPAALVEELTKWRREATDHWECVEEDSGI